MAKLRVLYDLLEWSEDGYFCRWEGKPFTGIAYEFYPSGQLATETEFVNGLEEGINRDWYPSGQLKAESEIYFDPLLNTPQSSGGSSGSLSEWFENGQLKREAMFKYSYCTRERKWDEEGTLISEYVINEQSPNYARLLEKQRKIKRRT